LRRPKGVVGRVLALLAGLVLVAVVADYIVNERDE
jgi:hypothetical protein